MADEIIRGEDPGQGLKDLINQLRVRERELLDSEDKATIKSVMHGWSVVDLENHIYKNPYGETFRITGEGETKRITRI